MSSELTFDMVIKMKDSILEFESEYNKELFNELKIDLSKEKVLLGSHEFKLTDTIDFPNDNNRVGSVWKAYQWTFQIPDKIDMSNVVQLAQTDVVLYRIAFGILQPSKTLYLSIKGVEVEKGVHIVNFVQPFFLKPKKE